MSIGGVHNVLPSVFKELNMIKNQIRVFYKSLVNIIMALAALIPAVLSYYETYASKLEVIEAIQSSTVLAEKQDFQKVLDGMNGLAYFLNYIFSSEYIAISTLIIGLGVCIVAGTTNKNQMTSGYGNLLVVRIGYKKYLQEMLVAQVVYTFTYTILFLTVLLAASLIWSFPASFSNISCNSNVRNYDAALIIMTLICQIILLAVYITMVNVISALTCVFIRNKYVIQTVPLIIFFVPYVAAIFIGSGAIGRKLLLWLAPVNYLLSINQLFNMAQTTVSKVLSLTLLPVILLLIGIVLALLNLHKYKEDYL